MPLLKELIQIPERVHQGDFVLKLSEGVSHAEQTLRDYVVTPQLVDSFENALGFVRQAVETVSSKAAYLHGSFGSGKSHFMAVLNLLLAGNTQARSIPELADVVAKHGWTHGKKFLLVPYHMIGARDMESAILGQYADFVRRLHPEAPVPGFYLAEGLFEDARRMREQVGDTAFFGKLNERTDAASDETSGWGDLDTGWDTASFEAATLEAPNGEERARLVGDLITHYFSAYRTLAESRGETFVSLDDGLSILSRHAKSLGYDAVILFLDELVLWLASHAADVNFVSREGTKLVKLVEATHADRPAPLISFVARQRDLRDLVGENLAGAVQVQFSDVLKHWEARFHRITLEDRNLPAIAEKRVLRPVSEAARQMVQAACEDVFNTRRDVLDTLLTTTADRDMFRKVYPFSPALVQTLIAVSAALQRERTALKLMLQLLVDRRNDLELGQLIPVGDLYDAIAEGDEPFSDAMRLHFENAKRLYSQKLLPMLERQHDVTWEAIKLNQADPAAAKNLRNDARLIKTLLLGALVPEVESLKALTPQRLAALNHGTIQSPIPGREAQSVLRKCREWASEVGEIKVADEPNHPLISIQVTGVDIEPILRAAYTQDNAGNSRKMIRELLFEQIGVQDNGGLFTTFEFTWRGTRREVEVLYENVREMSDDRLRGRSGSWTVVIDFPFDEANYGPLDDVAKLNAYRGGDTRTMVWLPSFLSDKALRDLGRLVVLDYILQGERFATYAANLSLVDRVQAQALARNQHAQLRLRLKSQIEVAYGISSEPRDAIAHPLTPDQQFRSLDTTLSPRPPVGADLGKGFEHLLAQLFAHQYPAHPEFDIEIKPAVLRKVWPELQRAAEAPDSRALLTDNATRRLVRSIINPCKLGQMGETHLLLERHWQTHFAQCQAREGVSNLTVGQLRKWIDEPRPMGLPIEVQNLIILTFAAQTNRSFVLHGGPFEPSIDNASDELELREQSLPNPGDWQIAVHRAAKLFGLVLPESLNASNVGRLVAEVRSKAKDLKDSIGQLVANLRDKSARFAAGGPNERIRTTESAQTFLAALNAADDSALVHELASARLETSEAAIAQTLGKLSILVESLSRTRWDIFEGIRDIQDHRHADSQRLIARVADALHADEHVIPLRHRMDELEREAIRLLTVQAAVAPTPPTPKPDVLPLPEPPAVATAPEAGSDHLTAPIIIDEQSAVDLNAAGASALLDDLKAKLAQDTELTITLSWRIQRKGKPQ